MPGQPHGINVTVSHQAVFGRTEEFGQRVTNHDGRGLFEINGKTVGIEDQGHTELLLVESAGLGLRQRPSENIELIV